MSQIYKYRKDPETVKEHKELEMSLNAQFIRDIKIIRINQLLAWKDLAIVLDLSYQQLLRIVNSNQPQRLSVKTKIKMRDFIQRNQDYL